MSDPELQEKTRIRELLSLAADAAKYRFTAVKHDDGEVHMTWLRGNLPLPKSRISEAALFCGVDGVEATGTEVLVALKLHDPSKDVAMRDFSEVARSAAQVWSWADEEWPELPVATLGFLPEAERKPALIQWDGSWGTVGNLLNVAAEKLGADFNRAEIVKVSAITPVFVVGCKIDDKRAASAEFLFGFTKIFDRAWSDALKRANGHVAEGFREAGRCLMRALHYRDARKDSVRIFGEGTDLLRNALSALSIRQESVEAQFNALMIIIRAMAAKISSYKQRGKVEGFWNPRPVFFIVRAIPTRVEKKTIKQKGRSVVESKTVQQNWLFGKAKEYATVKEVAVLKRWNDEADPTKWPLGDQTDFPMDIAAKAARFLVQRYQNISVSARTVLKKRKAAIFAAFKVASSKDDKLTFAVFAAAEVKNAVDDLNVVGLSAPDPKQVWTECVREALKGSPDVDVSNHGDSADSE